MDSDADSLDTRFDGDVQDLRFGCFRNCADLSASFQLCKLDFSRILFPLSAQGFEEIVFGQIRSTHCFLIQCPVADQRLGAALNH